MSLPYEAEIQPSWNMQPGSGEETDRGVLAAAGSWGVTHWSPKKLVGE